MNQEEQQDYLQFLIQECQDYIKEFEQLQQSLGVYNDEQENFHTNSKLKDEKTRLERELVTTCMEIERQRKEVDEYEREFERKRQELQQFDREIHEKESILAQLNKELRNQKQAQRR